MEDKRSKYDLCVNSVRIF